MADFVVDTNVWVWVDKRVDEIQTIAELDCIESCIEWFDRFSPSQDRLVVDDDHKILTEYYNNSLQSGRARRLINQLKTEPRHRLVELTVEDDENGLAKVPAGLEILKKNDRRLAALALAHDPTPLIINATDTDWAKAQQALDSVGLTVLELCLDYINTVLAGRS